MVTGAVEATLPNHWQQHRVGLQMEQQAQLATTKRVTTAAVLQPFRVAAVTTAGAFNGVGGNGSWWSSTEYSAADAYRRYMDYGTTCTQDHTISGMVSLFVVYGIRLFDYLSI